MLSLVRENIHRCVFNKLKVEYGTMCMTALSCAVPMICGSEVFHWPHVQFLCAEMWDKFLAKLRDYQILRKKSAAYSY
jgi:hypothetical protein